ncbi:four-carbon acid sugar kinase family protein [Arcticibacter sp.]|jgi:uncharacterized protein YgbK (DUF1537 family)|uniref:four-carbon acid sugar kinase family protein n=1 Tax=Arcticibacter sp. TaxID=1872630 RepID=UPI00388FC8E1
MKELENNLLMAFYGDDFTGSTDALESLSLAGIQTVLFIDPPTRDQLATYEGLQAIGVAGMTRSMPPVQMEDTLREAYAKLLELKPRHVHYKVCSTFDSSPVIGSIGKAIETGVSIFGSPFVPLLVAAPALGRYCVFGNLFARMGIGSDGKIHRLDRHPSMMNHPSTPSDESDLRLHLQKQTDKVIALVDILQIERPAEETSGVMERLVEDGAEIVLFDAIYDSQIERIGGILDAQAGKKAPLFSVGSSGVGSALASFWKERGLTAPRKLPGLSRSDSPILIVSGSCSPVTGAQIKAALSAGFAEIPVDPEIFESSERYFLLRECYVNMATNYINEGKNIIVHTSRGVEDERLGRARQAFKAGGLNQSNSAYFYGTLLGEIVREVTATAKVKRVVIAGGDTSSYAARAMGIESVEMISTFAPGAPLCLARAPGSPLDGLEVAFKGGQVGKADFFINASAGE